MAEFRAGTSEQRAFLEDLVEAGLLVPYGVPGVYGRGERFERVRLALEWLVRDASPEQSERISFPPLLPREHLETAGYLKSFPHLAGSVFAFDGDQGQAEELAARAGRHEDWSGFQSMTDLVLLPAACYPVYPMVAGRGPLPSGGLTVDVGGGCVFRNEPAEDPARLQVFHMHEFVRCGEREVVLDWRDEWRDRGLELLRSLGLDAQFELAADPFFGRGGRMLAANQREQELKFEITVPIAGDEPTAVASFNYHRDHFSGSFGIRTASGDVAHTACLGFGEERITLALFRAYGPDPDEWPTVVLDRLALRTGDALPMAGA
jgi:seryl-tRNA synthetase